MKKITKFLGQFLGTFIPKADSGPYSQSMSNLEDNRFLADLIHYYLDVAGTPDIASSVTQCAPNSVVRFRITQYWKSTDVEGYYEFDIPLGCTLIRSRGRWVDIKMPASNGTVVIKGRQFWAESEAGGYCGVHHSNWSADKTITVNSSYTYYSDAATENPSTITGDATISNTAPHLYTISTAILGDTDLIWSWDWSGADGKVSTFKQITNRYKTKVIMASGAVGTLTIKCQSFNSYGAGTQVTKTVTVNVA